MYGKSTISSFSINPNQFLKTKTYGISPYSTTLTARCRVGGGLSHNVAEGSVNTIDSALVEFPSVSDVSNSVKNMVFSTLNVRNDIGASGGEARQSLDDIRRTMGGHYASQKRIVTSEDYLARVYSMPSKFGRVYRAMVSPSTIPFVTELRVLSRDSEGNLIQSPTFLKNNLKTYLSRYISINEHVEIFDTKIINLGLNFNILVKSGFNKDEILSNALSDLYDYFNVMNFQIGQPILLSDVVDVIYNLDGVISVFDLEFINLSDNFDGRKYSDDQYNINVNKNVLLCPSDSMFEFKYLEYDIKGKVS
jgi:hypothetical protein